MISNVRVSCVWVCKMFNSALNVWQVSVVNLIMWKKEKTLPLCPVGLTWADVIGRYFLSTEDDPKRRHLYRCAALFTAFMFSLLQANVFALRTFMPCIIIILSQRCANGVLCFSANTTGSFNRRCLSCEFGCGFVSGSFTPKASYFLLNCKGQSLPEQDPETICSLPLVWELVIANHSVNHDSCMTKHSRDAQRIAFKPQINRTVSSESKRRLNEFRESFMSHPLNCLVNRLQVAHWLVHGTLGSV